MTLMVMLSAVIVAKGPSPDLPCVNATIERAELDGGYYGGPIFLDAIRRDGGLVCLRNGQVLSVEAPANEARFTVDAGRLGVSVTQEFLSLENCDGTATCVIRLHSEPVRLESRGSGFEFQGVASRETDAGVRFAIGALVPFAAAPAGAGNDELVRGRAVVRRRLPERLPTTHVTLVEGRGAFYVVENTIFVRPNLAGPRADWFFDFDDRKTESRPQGLRLSTPALEWSNGHQGSALRIVANEVRLEGDAGISADAVTVSLWVSWHGEGSAAFGKNQVLVGDASAPCGVVVVSNGMLQFAGNDAERAPLEPNVWHHVAVVSERATSRLLLDGEAVASLARRFDVAGLRIGACNGDRASGTMPALIDDLAIWRRALRDDEVRRVVRARER